MPTVLEPMVLKSMFQVMAQDPEIGLMSEFPKPDLEDRLPVLLAHREQDLLYLLVQDQQDLDNDLREVDLRFYFYEFVTHPILSIQLRP
jgi:hypothetical protein